MSKPDDISQEAWDAAGEAFWVCNPMGERAVSHESIARAILAAKVEAEAERDLLQDVLDSRPAINAALPDSYIQWSQAIYSGDIARAAIRNRGEG